MNDDLSNKNQDVDQPCEPVNAADYKSSGRSGGRTDRDKERDDWSGGKQRPGRGEDQQGGGQQGGGRSQGGQRDIRPDPPDVADLGGDEDTSSWQ